MREPGTLLASGRDSDIFDYGETMVLRRSRRGRSMREEARIMEYARAHGYPVPAVSEVSDDGTDLVMQRVDGPVMLAAIARRPDRPPTRRPPGGAAQPPARDPRPRLGSRSSLRER